mgnify:CR=1 FL=1
MSRLAELIEELCPDGVEYRPLGDVAELKRGQAVTRKEIVEGQIPVIAGGREPAYYIDRPNRQGETIVIAGSGAYAGFVSFWNEPIFVSDAFSIVVDRGTLQPRFVYHWLNGMQEAIHALKSGGGVPHVYPKDVAKLRCPIPPLEVQREIVRILDQFTTLEAELEAELEARRAQYEHYRNHLLSYESLAARGPVEMVKLGAVSRISAGYGFPKSEQGCSSGEYPFYKVSDMNHPGNQVFLEGASNYLSGPDIRRLKMTPFPAGAIVFPKIGAAIATNKKRILSCLSLVDNNVAVCIPEGVDGKYLYYWLLEQDLRFVAHDSGAVPSIRKTDLEQLDVPVPSVAEQERIVEVLDRFNALVNEISAGLPAEIAARRAQYEHYRDRLLSFPEKKAE